MSKIEALTIVASLCADGVLDKKEESILRKALAQPEQKYATTRNAWTGKATYKCNICGRDDFRSEHAAAFHECGEKAQPEQEPVSGWTGNTDADSALVMLDRLDVSPDDDERVDEISNIVRRLTTPPQRKPLTDEQIAYATAPVLMGGNPSLTGIARAIEAAHGIKE